MNTAAHKFVEIEFAGRRIFSLKKFEEHRGLSLKSLPYVYRVLLENLLRHESSPAVTGAQIEAVASRGLSADSPPEIAFHPARVVLQDFTGVPAVVDLAAMRDALTRLGGNAETINPLMPSELVIDHSVQVDSFGHPNSLTLNRDHEYQRNEERYQLLRWAQNSFSNFQVVPPATGIVHQVNLEYLARGVFEKNGVLFPDTLVGTDSHTTMINGLGVLGWGVGGIEAEAAMLGEPIGLLLPQVIGVRLHGTPRPGITATDIVLTLTERLRAKGVVGKFVEFFGEGLAHISLETRATISNMCPEFGSTCAIFPIDDQTIRYLRLTGRTDEKCALIEQYARHQGLYRQTSTPDPQYDAIVELDLSQVEACLSGPKRPQDRVSLSKMKTSFQELLPSLKLTTSSSSGAASSDKLGHGSVVIAAITSCTNTSNPSVMFAAGLLAQAAVARGLTVKPWVKTSLAPGSKVVTRYLKESGLLDDLEALKFHVVGYGCTTCIGNSGPLPPEIAQEVREHQLVVASVLSGNRNFEGRINPDVRANYLGSPPLVVAYALAGRVDIDFEEEPLGQDASGKPVFLRDLWPNDQDIQALILKWIQPSIFAKEYASVFEGDQLWKALPTPSGDRYQWQEKSTYVQEPPFFEGLTLDPPLAHDIESARVLLMLGDSITTDHISPAGAIASDSAAGKYLQECGVSPRHFNSYGSRRGNHQVMMRGTFANVRLRNLLTPKIEGGFSKHLPSGEEGNVFDVAMRYAAEGTPLIVLAGKEYGSGSSRDWAAKGTLLLGVRAVIAESYERIHRSNLVGMGVLPLQFPEGETRSSLRLEGTEAISIVGLATDLTVGGTIVVSCKSDDHPPIEFRARVRIDTEVEMSYYKNGGILPFVLRRLTN